MSGAEIEECVELWTREQVRRMSSWDGQCFIVIDEFVYDVTEFLGDHPGGSDTILEFIGRDATSAFDGKGHSEDAYKLLNKYRVGKLEDAS